jgi:hypothetical protein
MDEASFRSELGRLYRGFDRKPPSEEKVEALYRRIRRFHSHAWTKAVDQLICESTFPSLKEILSECYECTRRDGPSSDYVLDLNGGNLSTPEYTAFRIGVLAAIGRGATPRMVAELLAEGLDRFDNIPISYGPTIRDEMRAYAQRGDKW